MKSLIKNLFLIRVVNLYPADLKTTNGTKWGYINNIGNFIINPQYDYVMNYQANGLAIVEKDNLYGIINSLGKYLVTPVYNNIEQYSEGRASVLNEEGFKIIDESGNIITSKIYSYTGSFHDGRAQFTINDKNNNSLYGYLDRAGKEVIPPKFQSASDFNSKKALVKMSENQYALINLKGNIINTYKYPSMSLAGDNLLIFKENLDGKYGYIDETGKVIIPPQYSMAMHFNDGKAVVNMSDSSINKYGLIDRTGNFVIKPIYNDIKFLGENRLAVGITIDEKQPFIGSKYAISDTDGNLLTDFIYKNVSEYIKGFVSVSDSKKTFFIDKSVKPAADLPIVSGSGTLSLLGDLVQASVDNRISYFDKSKKLVWSQNNIIRLKIPFKVIEEKYKPNKDYIVYYPVLSGIEDKQAQNNVNMKLKEMSQLKPIDIKVQLDYSYSGDFTVKFFKKTLLVLELNSYIYHFGAAHGMPSMMHANIDLISGRMYKLKDLFKQNTNYVKVINGIISNQIKTKPEYSYVFSGGFKTIKPDQPFYLDENILFIYFYPYEIAPFAAGFTTFKIPFIEIKNIIDTDGDFWKAFKS